MTSLSSDCQFAARDLETAGIATVVIGSALDIVTWCNVPRYLHNDLPLGNPLGAPYDRTAQRKSIETAFQMISQMREPGVRMSDLAWPTERTGNQSMERSPKKTEKDYCRWAKKIELVGQLIRPRG